MLRYVSRRIKDTVERTCNVLEARRTWNFGNEGIGAHDDKPSSSVNNKKFLRHLDGQYPTSIFDFGLEPKASTPNVVRKKTCRGDVFDFQSKLNPSHKTSDSGSSDKEDFRERIRNKHQCNIQRDFIDALTWTSALICGWYTSQIMCMKRRRLQSGWNGECKYAKILMQPSQAFHNGILSYLVKAAPLKQAEAYVWNFNEENDKYHSHSDFYKEKFVEPVNDDYTSNDKKSSTKEQELTPETFDDAVRNLCHILGDIEFQLGVASAQTNRYDLAVSHFKLATSHSHASAAYNLGICYEEGIGVEKNLQMALECYKLASSLGHAKAMYNLGVFHARGLANLPKNRKAARECFKEAAKLGLNEANIALGKSPLKAVEPKISSTITSHQSLPIVAI